MLDFFKIEQHRIIFSIFTLFVLVILLIGVVVGVLVIINGIKSTGITKNTMSFDGQGKVFTKPDIAFVDLSVVTQGSQVKSVQEANTKKMNKVIEFLKSFGIEDKDIKTTNYNLYPQYNYESIRVPQIIGYQITQTLNIKIRNLDKVGDILQGGVDVGINQVNSLYFGVENDEQVKEQARTLAIAEAKEKAEKLAKELGVRLGRITNFSENIYGYPMPVYKEGYGVGGGGSPDIQTGENEVIVNVMITYEVR